MEREPTEAPRDDPPDPFPDPRPFRRIRAATAALITRRRRPALMALAIVAALALAACGGGDDEASDTSGGDGSGDIAAVVEQLGGEARFGTPAAGGTFRIENTDFAQSDAFDPSGEHLGSAWMIYNTTLLRSLLNYSFHSGDAGNVLRADLATEVPKPTDGGTKYTFTLRDGITFGPPVNRPITSKDIAYAIERIATPSVAAQYASHYRPIKGFAEFGEGKADTITGIDTPDGKTISFTLTAPKGDFPYALAMPASAPIPRGVARCHTQAGEYGRYIVSSGPYMIEGADKLDISSCASQKPISGFNPTRGLTLVRNPGYDPASDDTSVRESLPDRFEIGVNTNVDNIFDKIERGELEGSFETPTNAVLRRYLQDPEIRPRLRVNSGDRIWFMYMNLTTPPFDDVHVRKAMNLVMDLDGIQRSWGGPVQGSTPTDLLPDSMLPQLGAGYQPFQKAPYVGDAAAAMEEMKLSAYDTDKDGLCDAPACKGVINLNRSFAPWSAMSPIIEQSAAKIGITIETREASRSAVNNTLSPVARKIPLSSGNGWGKDYADPSTFMVLFDSRNIPPVGNAGFLLVGISGAQAKELKKVGFPAGGVPSVDADIDACNALAGTERTDCWVALDKRITEEIVPWVPLMDATAIDLIGPAVTKYEFDQDGNEMALAHVAVDPSLQK
jgi:peptide/nickel transport system substrate-binding protein